MLTQPGVQVLADVGHAVHGIEPGHNLDVHKPRCDEAQQGIGANAGERADLVSGGIVGAMERVRTGMTPP